MYINLCIKILCIFHFFFKKICLNSWFFMLLRPTCPSGEEILKIVFHYLIYHPILCTIFYSLCPSQHDLTVFSIFFFILSLYSPFSPTKYLNLQLDVRSDQLLSKNQWNTIFLFFFISYCLCQWVLFFFFISLCFYYITILTGFH